MNNELSAQSQHQQSDQPSSAWLEIGKIVAPQGLKGEVRVYPNSDFPERFETPGQRWLLCPRVAEPQAVELVRGYYLHGKGLYIIELAGVTNRTHAEALKDCLLVVPDSDRPTLEAGEFHIADLIGLEVFDQQAQTLIGSVINVFAAGNDLLEVQRNQPSQATVLIPLVKEIVPVVDLANRRLEITPPPGLLP